MQRYIEILNTKLTKYREDRILMAMRYIQDNLRKCCQDVLNTLKTGIVNREGNIRHVACILTGEFLGFSDDSVQIAEMMIYQEAVEHLFHKLDK